MKSATTIPLEKLLEQLPENYTIAERELVERAYWVADEAHREQKQASNSKSALTRGSPRMAMFNSTDIIPLLLWLFIATSIFNQSNKNFLFCLELLVHIVTQFPYVPTA